MHNVQRAQQLQQMKTSFYEADRDTEYALYNDGDYPPPGTTPQCHDVAETSIRIEKLANRLGGAGEFHLVF